MDSCDNCDCGCEWDFDSYCGAFVCPECGRHKGFDRCYCGWSASGNDGYSELLEMGETIEEE